MPQKATYLFQSALSNTNYMRENIATLSAQFLINNPILVLLKPKPGQKQKQKLEQMLFQLLLQLLPFRFSTKLNRAQEREGEKINFLIQTWASVFQLVNREWRLEAHNFGSNSWVSSLNRSGRKIVRANSSPEAGLVWTSARCLFGWILVIPMRLTYSSAAYNSE